MQAVIADVSMAFMWASVHLLAVCSALARRTAFKGLCLYEHRVVPRGHLYKTPLGSLRESLVHKWYIQGKSLFAEEGEDPGTVGSCFTWGDGAEGDAALAPSTVRALARAFRSLSVTLSFARLASF